MTDYPNDQGNPAAAIPVVLVIPQPGSPPYPNDQGQTGGAIPINLVPSPE